MQGKPGMVSQIGIQGNPGTIGQIGKECRASRIEIFYRYLHNLSSFKLKNAT